MFVRGGDGTLAYTHAVAPGCAGDGGGVLGSSIHTRRAYMPSLVICAALCRLRRCGLGGANWWGFFLCVFSGFPSLCLLCSLLGWCRVCSCLFGLRMRVCG